MKKLSLCLAAALVILAGCSPRRDDTRLTDQEYLAWLLDNMTDTEKDSYTQEFWFKNVRAALRARNAVERNIPEDIFRHFVLPVRTYMEPLDDFRMAYSDTLCALVNDLGIEDAALEINHWCLSYATYGLHGTSYDSPRGTIARGKGSCEELSVLTASALRAAGIPARVVVTKWAHADGMHSWVEVWTEEGWKFLGSCEPAARLNESWVNPVAPKCAQITSTVCGDYRGPEPVVKKTGASSVINVIGNYAMMRDITITVLDTSGKLVKDAHVEFKIYNNGALTTITEGDTDSKGCIKASFGAADIAVWASKDGMFGLEKISSDRDTVCLDRSLGKYARIDLDMRPGNQPAIPVMSTEAEKDACRKQIGQDDSLRAVRHAGPVSGAVIEQMKTAYAAPVKVERKTEEPVPDISVHMTGNPGKKGKASVSSIRGGRTIPPRGNQAFRGLLLVVTGTRLDDGSSLVRAELLPSPEGGKDVIVRASFRNPGE